MEVRHARERDSEALAGFDTSYSTRRVYAVEHSELSFSLAERRLEQPFTKHYPFSPAEATHVAVADAEIIGVCGVVFEQWNRRMRLEHLYVVPTHRRTGVGSALVTAAVEAASTAGSRVLWCETQNVNADAIDFYRRHGFVLVGLDASLYDGATDEVAIFLARDV